jgi:hypothetical protein
MNRIASVALAAGEEFLNAGRGGTVHLAASGNIEVSYQVIES